MLARRANKFQDILELLDVPRGTGELFRELRVPARMDGEDQPPIAIILRLGEGVMLAIEPAGIHPEELEPQIAERLK